ncbi:TIGR03086 family metal-binding protein [Embleya sp. NBC_00896]|uniref:TIGR03086 family metal-binding protein n=1 Tax=Embleya sp. NBC_00896 TaxID=2975961 RepID=UPI003864CFC3|nr:TIGR03086 family metal-binding protein [Embleya sp. NBC_00896]
MTVSNARARDTRAFDIHGFDIHSFDIGTLDIRALDRHATVVALDVLRLVRREHLELFTPCAGWTLRDLLGHLVAENRGFTAAAAGSTDPAAWHDDSLGAEPWTDFATSAIVLTAVFAAEDLLERKLRIRELGFLPGTLAMAIHFVDIVVHTWDIARTIGSHRAIEPELALAALEFARQWESVRPPGAFGVAVEVPADASPGDRLVAFLGRTPFGRTA